MTAVTRGRSIGLALSRPHRRVYALRLVAVALLALAVAYFGVSYRVAEGVTHVKRNPVTRAALISNARPEDVSLRSLDGGLTLRGWFYRVPGDRAVISVHGKDSNRLEGRTAERIADVLLANGYSVLLFDLRGHGESEGNRFSLGQHERYDVAAAIDFLVGRGFREERIALLGMSMGAGTVLQTVAVRPGVGPVIADSAYSDGRVIVEEVGPAYTGLPRAFNPGVIVMSRLFFDLDVDQIKPAAVVRAHPERAFLFIHCEDDRTVYPHHSPDLKAASANPGTQLWLAPACGHVQAFPTYPSEYEQRLLSFLGANMR